MKKQKEKITIMIKTPRSKKQERENKEMRKFLLDFFDFLNYTFFSERLFLKDIIVAEKMRVAFPDFKQEIKDGLFFNAFLFNSKKDRIEDNENFIFVANKKSYNKVMRVFLHELTHLIEIQLYKTNKQNLKTEKPEFHSKKFNEIENNLIEKFLCLKHQILRK